MQVKYESTEIPTFITSGINTHFLLSILEWLMMVKCAHKNCDRKKCLELKKGPNE